MQKSLVIQSKIVSKQQLEHLLHIWRFKDQKIVFTNGCFDILHYGHIHLLSHAADMGNKLIVGLNSDVSVQRLKGKGRPVNTQHNRSWLLASLFFVDAIIIFDEDTPLELIQAIKPDVLVKGSDYTPGKIVGADFVKSYGGIVDTVPLVQGYSTTAIINGDSRI